MRAEPASARAVPMTRMQRAVARRMALARSEVPEFAAEVEVDMMAASRLRHEARAAGRFVPSYNHLVIKACAIALRDVPEINVSYGSDMILVHPDVHVGIAVAVDGGLVVPVIRDADRLSLEDVAAVADALAARARARTIRAEELTGGTFTVSNLGMYGVARFSAIINRPQAAILAVGAVEERVVAHQSRPAVRLRMSATLIADHRVVYGADTGRFLAAFRARLEAPDELDGDVRVRGTRA